MFQSMRWFLAVVVAGPFAVQTKAVGACTPLNCSIFDEALPADGSSGVPLNAELRVRYAGPGPSLNDGDEPEVDIQPMRLVSEGRSALELRGSELADARDDARWLVARPPEALAASTEYSLQVLLDDSNACAPERDWVTVSTFTTGEASDDDAPDFAGGVELNARGGRQVQNMCGTTDFFALIPELGPLTDDSPDTRYNVYVGGEPHRRYVSSWGDERNPLLRLDCLPSARTPTSIIPNAPVEVRAVDLAGNETEPAPLLSDSIPDICNGIGPGVDDAPFNEQPASLRDDSSSSSCALSRGNATPLGSGAVLSLLLLWFRRRSLGAMSRLPMALLVLFGSACSEIEDQCAAACIQGFDVAVEGPGPLPDGDYEVQVAFPDEGFVCPRTFPPDDTVPPAECGPEARVYVTRIQPPLSEPTGFSISTRETPRTFGLTIRYDGVVLVSESFTPSYQRSTICGQSCLNAGESVMLPALTTVDAGLADAASSAAQ